MLGVLTDKQVEALLRDEIVGRIGCHAADETYVVPISFAYDGKAIYAHSRDGRKLAMMRAAPRVCFEVDRMRNLTNWESVIAWGRFEELRGQAASDALALLVERLAPHFAGHGAVSAHAAGPSRAVQASAFRIVLDVKSGRFESTD